MDPEQSLEVISKENKFLQLPATVDDIIGAMNTYQELLKQLLTNNDYATILDKKCIKKSGWLKLALAFNLSIKIVKETKEIDPEDSKHYSYHITVECIAPNGRTTSELGTCDTYEKKENEHVIRSMAMTRAKSRAIASMIGASESSAEEMESVKTIDTFTLTHSNSNAPTQKQLDYLKLLKYTGRKPDTKEVASNIIEDLKNTVKEAETIPSTVSSVDCTCDDSSPSSINSNICQHCGNLMEEK